MRATLAAVEETKATLCKRLTHLNEQKPMHQLISSRGIRIIYASKYMKVTGGHCHWQEEICINVAHDFAPSARTGEAGKASQIQKM